MASPSHVQYGGSIAQDAQATPHLSIRQSPPKFTVRPTPGVNVKPSCVIVQASPIQLTNRTPRVTLCSNSFDGGSGKGSSTLIARPRCQIGTGALCANQVYGHWRNVALWRLGGENEGARAQSQRRETRSAAHEIRRIETSLQFETFDKAFDKSSRTEFI
jgi:hypothetical protein